MMPVETAPSAVVGIGASAGGLQAYTEFFNALPPDTGMAFVVVQHLAAEHESHLASLLARTTRMPVIQVEDQRRVLADCIYVIPPNRTLVIDDGHLTLRDRPPGLHLPVDIFLTTLADTHGAQAIGIVFSGTGGDGSRGIEAIKARGGITFAQDGTAQYASMPQSAINTGCVDFILSPREIATELGKLAAVPELAFGDAPADPSGHIDDIVDILRERLNIDFSQYKPNTLRRRISRRMALKSLSNLVDYQKFLLDKPEEIHSLYQDILISVTNFFRDPETFAALKQDMFPALFARVDPAEALRVWSVGCSTGEEVYSLAMSLMEYRDENRLDAAISVFGTDANSLSIERARRGWYPSSIAQEVSATRLQRFFREADGGYVVQKALREICIFAPHNTLSDPPFSRMDLVSCRNLLIYFRSELQRQLLPKLHYALNPGGMLFLGGSESISHYHELFELKDAKHKFYEKRAILRRLEHAFPVTERKPVEDMTATRGAGARPRDSASDRQRIADTVLLKQYSPAGVLIDADGEILQFRGDTSPYLTLNDGKASLNIFKLAREGYFATLRSVLQAATQSGASDPSQGMVVDNEGVLQDISIRAIPVSFPAPAARCYWLLFEPGNAAAPVRAAAPAPFRPGDGDPLALLTRELAATREHLESTIQSLEAANDDLQSANEEIRSANEELQSTNEELETSKEEIQSSNEELSTVNDELRLRNVALDLANDDLNNVFSSVEMAVVMVWRDLRIRRYTPPAQRMFNILQSDVGRPIGDMNHSLEMADLPQMLIDVIGTEVGRELQVGGRDGCSYQLRIRPYRTQDGVVDGATLVVIDVSAVTEAQEALRARVAELAAADRHKNEFLAIVAHELRNPLAPLRNAAHVLKLAPADAAISAKARELIERQVHHMSRLVGDLLDAARAGNGQINLQRERVDLRTVLRHAADLWLPQFESRSQTLTVELPVEAVSVDGDATRLEQVFSNLLSNANKYTGEKGRIVVTVWAEAPAGAAPEAHVRVADDGEGIEAELIPRIFKLFTQADRSIPHSQGGLGIGLNLVDTLVQLHRGRVRVHSDGPGKGSVFTVTFPLRPASPADRRDVSDATPPATGETSSLPGYPAASRAQRVLVVEDNPDIRDSTSTLLSMVGHEVATAGSGLEALAVVASFNPTAVVLDIGLPDVSGYEIARRMRKMPQFVSTLLIAVSGYDTPEARRLSLEAGFDHHVAKPVPFSELEDLLKG